MVKNSQTLQAGIYLVATPIGNLGDITLRALDVLKRADVIACEDTRVTGKLLMHYGIKTRTTSYHDHNEEEKTPQLIAEAQAGKIVALVSDAGTPLISDPGFRLVSEAAKQGVRVIPIPGASSTLAALSASGLPSNRFLFVGFLPPKAGIKARIIDDLADVPVTIILFESAQRLGATLAAFAERFSEREAVVARELTKLHEEFRRGTLKELATHYENAGAPKGEVVIIIAPPLQQAETHDTDGLLTEALKTLSVKDAASQVAKITGMPRQELYAKALALKGQP